MLPLWRIWYMGSHLGSELVVLGYLDSVVLGWAI